MAVTADAKTVDMLNQLVTMDRAAAAAYEAAAEQIRDRDAASTIREFGQDHARHVRDLTQALRDMGAQIEEKPEVERKLARSAQQVRQISEMRPLLEGMRDNEELTNQMYARAADLQGIDASLSDLIQRNYADERRHINWIEQQLQQLRRGSGAARQQGGGPARQRGGGSLDLNAASVDEIAAIEGIGRRRAEDLVRARPFDSWDQVRGVEGFDEVLVDKIRAEASLGRR